MNTLRITLAVKEIDRLTTALAWLREHGAGLKPRERESFAITFGLIHASACHGAKEASEQLAAIARLHIEDIIAHAILDAENTINMSKDAIRSEATAP